MQYENFTQLPGEDIDAMFQRFTAIVNNTKANVEDFPYTEHDQALKLLHILDQNIWGAKVEDIKESGQYLTIELDDLFSKLKSSKVDRKLQSKHEGSTDHSLALVGGANGKANTNPSCRQFSLSSLVSILDDEFDVLSEEELACSQGGLIDYMRTGGMQGGARGHATSVASVDTSSPSARKRRRTSTR
jgi:hypothetical protein